MAGRYFDEWQVGDTVAHAVTRTVTETDNVLISTLTHNPQPMHLDHEVAASVEFGKPLVNSIFTFGLMIGVSGRRHHARHAGRQPRLRQAGLPQPGVRRRHVAQRKRMHRRARKQVAAQCRHRHLGAPQLQPARRAGVRMHPHRAAAEESRNDRAAAPGCSSPPTARRRSPRRSTAMPTRSSSTSRTASRPAQKAAARDILKDLPKRSNGPQWWVRINPLGSEYHKDDLTLIGSRRRSRHRPAQGGKRRRRHRARPPHRQHPDPRHRHRNRGQPVRPALLPRPEVAAGGDELGRRGSVGRARRVVQI